MLGTVQFESKRFCINSVYCVLLSNYTQCYLRCILCSEMAATRSNPNAVKVPLNLSMPHQDLQEEEAFRTVTNSISPFDENSSFADTGNIAYY